MSSAPAPSSSSPTSLRNAVIRLAGNSQDGIQSIGGFLARLAGRTAQEVMTYMTIPSTISGGPSIFQVHLGSGEVLHEGDEADVLVAFYKHSYENHIAALRDVRREISMAKVFATEMAWEILDQAMQTFGAMGMTKELPLQLMASLVRTMRIYDGPSEVHRMVIARTLMNTK